MPELRSGMSISQPTIGIFDPVIDENNEIKEYKERKGVDTVITDEPLGKVVSNTYRVLCNECNKLYEYKCANDAELELMLQKEGWRSSLDLEKAFCPKCVEMSLRKELLDKNKK